MGVNCSCVATLVRGLVFFFLTFGRNIVPTFLNHPGDFCINARNILKELLKQDLLSVEICVLVEVGMPFVKGTYWLEGNGPVSIYAWRVVQSLFDHCNQVRGGTLPSTQALVGRLVKNSDDQKRMMGHAQRCVEPGLLYYEARFQGDLQNAVKCFESFDLCNPLMIKEMSVEVVHRKLVLLHDINPYFLPEEVVHSLMNELPRSIIFCGHGQPEEVIMWHRNVNRVDGIIEQVRYRTLESHRTCI